MRAPIEHRYVLDEQPYLLREPTMFEGQQRLQQYYALALTLAPGTVHPDTGHPLVYQDDLWRGYAQNLERLYGGALYAKAVTQECLVEAPDFWWLPQPVSPSANGTTRRVITFRQVPQALWIAHLQEVNVFLEAIFRADDADTGAAVPGRESESPVVAPVQDVSPMLRGRAE